MLFREGNNEFSLRGPADGYRFGANTGWFQLSVQQNGHAEMSETVLAIHGAGANSRSAVETALDFLF